MLSLDQMILKAIPINSKCAIEEQYNKHRRNLLKQRFEDYLADQLSQQFNARPFIPSANKNKNEFGLDRDSN